MKSTKGSAPPYVARAAEMARSFLTPETCCQQGHRGRTRETKKERKKKGNTMGAVFSNTKELPMCVSDSGEENRGGGGGEG